MDEQNKNLLLATVLSFVVILTWFWLFPPADPATQTDPATASATTAATPQVAAPAVNGATPSTPAVGQTAVETLAATADAPRINVRTPSLTGTISLIGGRLDDLSLVKYHETLDPGSDLVRQLSPFGSENAYYALYGWAAGDGVSPEAVPGPNTVWTQEAGDTLTPEAPVTLKWDNGAGLIFHRTISVDADYMFTVTQSVDNTTGAAVNLAPYGIVARHGNPVKHSTYIAHEGLVQMSDGILNTVAYGKLKDLPADTRSGGVSETQEVASNGWIGFADKYWMTSLIPQPGTAFRSTARFNPTTEIYQTETVAPMQTVAPGGSAEVTSMLFSGAKEWELLRGYEQKDGVQKLVEAIDWGWFFFFTKPIFWLLHHLHGLIGNMGWSIVALTVILKALVLPLAYKSYVSMAKMKELQPEMEALKERTKEDKQALQQGMMKLYKDNKVNPASGCLPILIQIPIFFSLYKVIFNTIELRQAGWIGWIHDLSLPDPSSILNLFGLLPFAAPGLDSPIHIISLGILPIILGISMWLQQKLNPAPADPTQQAIFAWMPWIFMFMLGSFASGLVLYWITNNTITFIQQYSIMRSHGHKPDVFGNILGAFRRKPVPAAANKPSKPSKPGSK